MTLLNKTKILIFIFLTSCSSNHTWRTASRDSANLSPKVKDLKEDIFQIFYARAYSWKGYLAVHPWVAWKEKEESSYTVAQVTAWNIRRSGQAVRVAKDLPDRKWFNNTPTLLFEARGEKAKAIITQAKKLIEDYPFNDKYRLWPGPNSNTFVSYLTRNISEIDKSLPAHAIGKDYFGATTFLSKTSSQTGFQFSFFGALGLTLGLEEGIEVNLLGLHFGIDFWKPAIGLPFIGRIGFSEAPIFIKKKGKHQNEQASSQQNN